MAIDIVVRGEYENSGAFADAQKDIDRIGDASDATTGRLGNLGGALGGLALGGLAAGAAALGGAIVGIGVAAVDFAGQSNQALNDLQAQFGLTEEEALGLGEVAETVFANNFGENIGEVNHAVALTEQKLGDLGVTSDAELAAITEDAFALRDAFGIELNDSLAVTETLMEDFGLTSTQAMDLYTSAQQRGLDASGDLLDTLTEYGPQIAANGLDAAEFLNLVESGAEAGVLGTDKMGDALKEFFIILNAGGPNVEAAFNTIGLNFAEIQASVASGKSQWGDYTQSIIDGINSIEDPILKGQTQVALFGTMGEDLGVSFTNGLTTAGQSLDTMAGATDSLTKQYENFDSVFQTIARQTVVALEPISAGLLDLANAVMPSVITAFAWFNTNLPQWIAAGQTAFERLRPIIETVGQVVAAFGTQNQGTWNMIGETIRSISTTVSEIIRTVFGAIQAFWNDHHETIKRVASFVWEGIKSTIKTVLGVIDGLLKAGLAVMKGDWKGAGDAIMGILSTLAQHISTIFNGILSLIRDLGPGFLAAAKAIGQAIVDGIAGAISAGARWIADAARNAANSALNAAKNALGIKSPSSLFEDVGKNSIQGWINGLLGGEGDLANAVSNLARSVAQQAASAMLAGISGSLRSLPSAANYGAGAQSILNQVQVTINQSPGERDDQLSSRVLEGLLGNVSTRG